MTTLTFKPTTRLTWRDRLCLKLTTLYSPLEELFVAIVNQQAMLVAYKVLFENIVRYGVEEGSRRLRE